MMKLIPTLEEFNKEIDILSLEGEMLIASCPVKKTEHDLMEFKEKSRKWREKSADFIKFSFEPVDEETALNFRNATTNGYRIPGTSVPIETQIKDEIANLKDKVSYLKYYKRIVSVADLLVDPERVEREKRSSWTTEQIIELLLYKLYELYDELYHPIGTILEYNGIRLKRHGEETEIGNLMENYGYIKLMKGRSPSARLTLEGKIAVENTGKVFKENYDEIPSNKEEVASRINEIVAELRKLGYGQEILFEELQEIKEMYSKLSKKNWGQLIKGKLVDLALGKVVENEVIKYVYEKITNHQLLLP